MQRRLRRKSGASTAIRPYLGLFGGRCRAALALGAPPSFQMVGSARRSGPKLQARSAVCEERANSNALPKQGRLRRKYGTPAARRPYHLFSRGAAASQDWQNHGQQKLIFCSVSFDSLTLRLLYLTGPAFSIVVYPSGLGKNLIFMIYE